MASVAELSLRLVSRFVTLAPKIEKTGDRLVARTGALGHVLGLGSGSTVVRVDPKARVVQLERRRFWFLKRVRRIEFDWIEEITYGYAGVGPGVVAYEEIDVFSVGLRLKNEEEVELFRFIGNGEFVNNGIWPDWMYWPEVTVAEMSRGSQDSLSLTYAELLSGLIGVPVGSPRP